MTLIIAFCLYQQIAKAVEGQLQLLTHHFEHPQLKVWENENAPLLGGLQKGIDLMQLNDGDELRLVQSADSLSQAHGFLSFDYRIYGIAASYTADNAQSLLPKILAELQTKFNVGSSIPFVLMISWFEHEANQADMLLYVQWNGFARLSAYEPLKRGQIEDLTNDAFGSTFANNTNYFQKALAAALAKFNLLLNPVAVGYFIVDGKKYGPNDTLFTCQCAVVLKVNAYRNDSLPFTKNGKQKWSNAKYLSGNVAEIDRMKASAISGTVIQADLTDSVGLQHSATLRVYVVDVDFEDAKGKYGFDENEIPQYISYSKDPNGDFIRWKNIPKTFSDNILVKIKPNSVAHKVYFSTGSGTVTPQKATSGSQIVTISVGAVRADVLKTHVGGLQGCDHGKMTIWCPDTTTINIKYVVLDEEDDDVQLISFNQGLPNTQGILPGGNNQIDSQLKPDDQIVGMVINTGADGLLNTTVHKNDIIAPKIKKTGNGEMNQLAIGLGVNNFLDTDPTQIHGDDSILKVNGIVTGIENGVDGKTETNADSTRAKINASGFTNNLNTYTNYTSNVYEKVGIKFISDLNFDHIAVNYDLDYDGLLNKAGNNEYQALIDNYNKKRPNNPIKTKSKTVIVIFIKGYTNEVDVSGNKTDGISLSGSNSSTLPLSMQCGGRSIAHEIGHAIFNLEDQDDLIPAIPAGADSFNLMAYDLKCNGTVLRAFQWIKIQDAVVRLR